MPVKYVWMVWANLWWRFSPAWIHEKVGHGKLDSNAPEDYLKG
jgi:hypothetical protein